MSGIFRPLKVGKCPIYTPFIFGPFIVFFFFFLKSAIEITGCPGPPWIRIVVCKKNTWKPGEDDPMKDEYVAFKWVGSSTNQLLLDFGWL